VLELQSISVEAGRGQNIQRLLNDINLTFPEGHFAAIIGPSGCGKSTLLRTIAGFMVPSEGQIFWRGLDTETQQDISPSDLGYVPQFSIAHDFLSIRESVGNALRLRVAELSREERNARLDEILGFVELAPIEGRLVKVLSGGQKRRLALAMELASKPALLLCDEVTSGLDPLSEEEIVHLLARLAQDEGRTILLVTHSLRHLHLYDSVAILGAGHLLYHGPAASVMEYFGVATSEEIFYCLKPDVVPAWAEAWRGTNPSTQSEEEAA